MVIIKRCWVLRLLPTQRWPINPCTTYAEVTYEAWLHNDALKTLALIKTLCLRSRRDPLAVRWLIDRETLSVAKMSLHCMRLDWWVRTNEMGVKWHQLDVTFLYFKQNFPLMQAFSAKRTSEYLFTHAQEILKNQKS